LTEFFSSADLDESVKKLKFIPLAHLNRMRGLELIRFDEQLTEARKVLGRAIFLRPSMALDPKLLAGLVISYLPLKIFQLVKRILWKNIKRC
jgi:hypothetical protein